MRLCWVVCAFLLAAAAGAQDFRERPSASLPEFFDTHPTALDTHFRRVMANDQVEVIRVHLNPHEKTMVMELPAHVMTCVTDQNVRLIYPRAKPVERAQKAGYAGWVERDEYGVENVGDKPAEWIMIVPNSSRETG
jgi:hypothetical protein